MPKTRPRCQTDKEAYYETLKKSRQRSHTCYFATIKLRSTLFRALVQRALLGSPQGTHECLLPVREFVHSQFFESHHRRAARVLPIRTIAGITLGFIGASRKHRAAEHNLLHSLDVIEQQQTQWCLCGHHGNKLKISYTGCRSPKFDPASLFKSLTC